VQCKLYGFVKNRKPEGIVVGAVLRTREIPDNYVFMYPDEKDVTLVISVNNYPAVWTVTCPNSTWAQCDCPMGMRGNICKHQVKVFKLLYPKVEDVFIIRHAGTLKGTMEGRTNNYAIHAFQGAPMVNTGDGTNMHSTSFAEKNNIDNQFQVFLEGMREIESLVTQDKALIPFTLALVNNVKGKIFDRQAKAQA
jgi:hypothetical protein